MPSDFRDPLLGETNPDGMALRLGRSLLRAGTAVVGESTFDGVGQAIVREAERLGALLAHVYVTTETRWELRLLAEHGLPADLRQRMGHVHYADPLLSARAAATGQLQVIEDVAEIPPELVLAREVATRSGAGAVISAPLRAQGRLQGVVTWFLPRAHRFTESERELLNAIAELFALGIANVRALEAERRARTALAEAEERFRRFTENARDVIWRYRMDPPGYDFVNSAVERMVGISREALLADVSILDERIHPEDKPLLARLGTDPESLPNPLIVRWRREDGSYTWTESHLVVLRDFRGRLEAVEGISRDITPQREALEERERLLRQIEEERAWLRAVIERSPIGITIFSDHGRSLVLSNARAEELFGFAPDPHKGAEQFARHVMHPVHRRPADPSLTGFRAFRGEVVTNAEELIVRPDGTEIPLLASAGPIVVDGRMVGAVIIFQDITRQKELERQREEWTSVIAHDLRQPVTVINLHAAQLRRRLLKEAPELAPRLDHLIAAGNQLGRMISDLLDASRLEASRLEIHRQVVDLGDLLRAVIERQSVLLGDRRIEVETHGGALVECDPDRLEQVLGNLLSNALKYGEPGQPIVVRLERTGREARVSVTNHGRGIPPDEIGHVFERFRRTRESRSGRVRGIGLGLYITKGIVEAHGGRIWVESEPGRLTSFTFALPLARASDWRDAGASAPA